MEIASQSASAIEADSPAADRAQTRPHRRGRTTSPPSDPFLRVLPRDVEVEPDPLQLRLDFHRESTIRYDYAGGRVKVALVSALDVAHALASELDLTTGILPPDTLWLAKTGTGTRLALWVPPGVRTVRLRERYDAPPRRLRLPFPGLVFLTLPDGQAPYVFAARRGPRRRRTPSSTPRPSTSSTRGGSARARTASRPTRRRCRRRSSRATSRRRWTPSAGSRGGTPRISVCSGPSCTPPGRPPIRSMTWCRTSPSPTRCGSANSARWARRSIP